MKVINLQIKFVGIPLKNVKKKDYFLTIKTNQENITLKDVLQALSEKGIYVDLNLPGILVLINGINYQFLGGLHSEIKNGALLVITTFAGGG
uniref:MoaD/ThiS family protein n=1 Tax=candidate division WOR-3 bacterium TaxID=2052148 RepID=A0A7C2P3Y1_UNCW3